MRNTGAAVHVLLVSVPMTAYLDHLWRQHLHLNLHLDRKHAGTREGRSLPVLTWTISGASTCTWSDSTRRSMASSRGAVAPAASGGEGRGRGVIYKREDRV